MSCPCMGRWKPPKRKVDRSKMPAFCFLFPGSRKFIICPGRGRDPNRPTCEGVLAARRRAVLNRDFEAERRAIRRAKLLGCPWGAQATAKHRGTRRSRRAAA